MSLDDRTYQLIEDYLSGSLTADEAKAFEERLATDKELALELEIYQQMEGLINENGWVDSKIETDHTLVQDYTKAYLSDEVKSAAALLDSLGEQAISSETKIVELQTKDNKWQILRIAAAVFVFAGLAWLFVGQSKVTNYANKLQHEEILLAQRGDSQQLMADAEQAYNNGNYAEAIPLLIAADKVNNDYSIDLALGVAHLEVNQLDEALKLFNKVYNSDSIIKDKALWYKAMTQLKQKDKLAAKATLEQLQSAYPYYQQNEVTKLLKKLN